MTQNPRPADPVIQDFASRRSPRDHLSFRQDINALRAIAVASVVLFHFHLPWAWGGFVGVDVFFVISGFLMTQIILKRQVAGSFRVLDFYADRARRIIPALWVVSAALLAFGIVILDPSTLRNVARSVASTLTFLSNFDYAAQGGYFGGVAEENWLLHTWSLSLEWQFYILYPLLFLGFAQAGVRRQRVWIWLAGLGALSLMLCVAIPLLRSDVLLRGSFFLLPTRAWELLAGGVVAAAPPTSLGKCARSLMRSLGLLVILVSIVSFSRVTVWPSIATVLPVLGTTLVIAAGRSDAAWPRVPGVLAVGRWSYSIYLWHWPLVAFYDYRGITGPVASVVGIVLSLAMGAASYRFIEQGLALSLFGNAPRSTPIGKIAGPVAIGVLIAVTGVLFVTHGLYAIKFPASEPQVVSAARHLDVASADWTFPESCNLYRETMSGLRQCRQGGGGPIATLVVGDSYTQMIAPRYASLPKGRNDPAVLFLTRSGCVPLPDVQLAGSLSDCAKSTAEALATADTGRFSKIVVVAAWRGALAQADGEPARGRICFPFVLGCRASADPATYGRDVKASFARLSDHLIRWRKSGAAVTVIKTFPQSAEGAPKRLLAALYRDRSLPDQGLSTAAMRKDLAYPNGFVDQLVRDTGAMVIDPLDHLCADACPLVVGGEPLFIDGSHFRASAVSGPGFAFLDHAILPDQYP